MLKIMNEGIDPMSASDVYRTKENGDLPSIFPCSPKSMDQFQTQVRP